MSTVPEVIVAVHCGLRAVGFSIVTDVCFPDSLEPANVEAIIRVANEAQPKLTTLVRGLLSIAGIVTPRPRSSVLPTLRAESVTVSSANAQLLYDPERKRYRDVSGHPTGEWGTSRGAT